MKTIELTHDEVCHALINYIERDKDEKVIGTPTLCITSDERRKVQVCTLVLNSTSNENLSSFTETCHEISEEKAQEIGREVHEMFLDACVKTQQEIQKLDNQTKINVLKNYDSRDSSWIINLYK
jgi:hypothetical protein